MLLLMEQERFDNYLYNEKFQCRILRKNRITEKLGKYLLEGDYMLNDTCQDCNA